MIQIKATINGTDYRNFKKIVVDRTTSEYGSSAMVRVIFDNPYGKHKNDFIIGDEIQIFADKDATPTTLIFTGLVDNIRFSGEENRQNVVVSGKDYTARLKDVTVQPIVYTDSEISTIVSNIMTNEVSDVTINNVDTTSTTLTRIAFNHNSVYEALKQLAELSGFIFYVDENKDLHFEKKNNISSGVVLNNSNIVKIPNFRTTKEDMFNSVWVYGDSQLDSEREIPLTDGGSVFTLANKPHNTQVDYLGSRQRGGIFQINEVPPSGTDYLVSFQDKQVIFISGTDLGYSSIPSSGGSVVIDYFRDVPIIRFGQDNSSIAMYGIKEKIIDDRSIKDPNTAEAILKQELEKSNPFKGVEVEIKGWFNLTPGNTVDITIDDFNLSETGIGILNISYFFDKRRTETEQVIKLKLDKKIKDITDSITDLKNRIDKIEAQNRQTTDILPRLEIGTGSMLIVGSYWEVRTRSIAGDGLIWGNSSFGIWGIGKWGNTANISFVLGNIQAAVLGTSELGTQSSSYNTIASGGYY